MRFDSLDCDIVGINNSYDTGIKWLFVAGKPNAIDYGLDTGHWTADITIQAPVPFLNTVKTSLETDAPNGKLFSFSDYEPVFGPEIYYKDEILAYVTSIGTISQPLGPVATFDFSITAQLTNKISWGYNTLDQATIQAMKREHNKSIVIGNTYSGNYGSDFIWDAPTCEVQWYGTKAQAKNIRRFLINARSTKITLNVYGNESYFFDPDNSGTEEGYILNIGSCIPDISGNWFTVNATVGKA